MTHVLSAKYLALVNPVLKRVVSSAYQQNYVIVPREHPFNSTEPRKVSASQARARVYHVLGEARDLIVTLLPKVIMPQQRAHRCFRWDGREAKADKEEGSNKSVDIYAVIRVGFHFLLLLRSYV
jgi:hypothetical protein